MLPLAILVLALSNCAQAQSFQRRPPRQEAAGAQVRAAGPVLQSGSERYQAVLDVRAVRTAGRDYPPQAVLQAIGEDQGEVVQTQGTLVFYRPSATGAAPSAADALTMQATPSGHQSLPVVRNLRTGQLGVVPGTIVLRLRDPAQAPQVAADFDLKLETEPMASGHVVVRAAAGQDPFAVSVALRADPRVAEAGAEVLENPAVPQ
jgi:hypothetical protein